MPLPKFRESLLQKMRGLNTLAFSPAEFPQLPAQGNFPMQAYATQPEVQVPVIQEPRETQVFKRESEIID